MVNTILNALAGAGVAFLLSYTFYLKRKIARPTPDQHDTHADSPISEHILIREKELDERIERMSLELKLARSEIGFGKPADELHPDVKNLPHTSVHQNAPDVEYSE